MINILINDRKHPRKEKPPIKILEALYIIKKVNYFISTITLSIFPVNLVASGPYPIPSATGV